MKKLFCMLLAGVMLLCTGCCCCVDGGGLDQIGDMVQIGGLLKPGLAMPDQYDQDAGYDEEIIQATIHPFYENDFTVTDAWGNEVSLSDFAGKPVVLNFWATWCGPCVHELPEFQKAYIELGWDVEFLMVNVMEDREIAEKFIQGEEYTFPVFYDIDNSLLEVYPLHAIPQTYFYNGEGELVYSQIGSMDYDTLMNYIEQIR